MLATSFPWPPGALAPATASPGQHTTFSPNLQAASLALLGDAKGSAGDRVGDRCCANTLGLGGDAACAVEMAVAARGLEAGAGLAGRAEERGRL